MAVQGRYVFLLLFPTDSGSSSSDRQRVVSIPDVMPFELQTAGVKFISVATLHLCGRFTSGDGLPALFANVDNLLTTIFALGQ